MTHYPIPRWPMAGKLFPASFTLLLVLLSYVNDYTTQHIERNKYMCLNIWYCKQKWFYSSTLDNKRKCTCLNNDTLENMIITFWTYSVMGDSVSVVKQ